MGINTVFSTEQINAEIELLTIERHRIVAAIEEVDARWDNIENPSAELNKSFIKTRKFWSDQLDNVKAEIKRLYEVKKQQRHTVQIHN